MAPHDPDTAPLLRSTVDALGLNTDSRTVTVRLCRWDEPRKVNDGAGPYREQIQRGSLELADAIQVMDAHHGNLIGRAIPETFRDEDDGPLIDLVIARTQAGNDAIALLDADVVRDVSMEIIPVEQITADNGVVVRTRSILSGVALAFRPAHDAPVMAVRSQLHNGEMMHPMPDTPTPVADPVAETVAVDVADRLDRLDRSIDDMKRDYLERVAHNDATNDPAHPLAKFRSLAEFADAHYETGSDRTLFRVLADQITDNNPGVIPPAWVRDVKGIIDQTRACVMAFGGAKSLPASGMELTWPYFDGDLSTLVGEQLAEKTDIVSVQVDLLRGTAPIKTFAGGSDVSYQLIRRSDPSYRDAYLRIMAQAYALATETDFALAIDVAAGDPTYVVDWATIDLGTYLDALFNASMDVETATGQPAGFAVCGSRAFRAIGTLPGLTPGTYAPNQELASGIAAASTLRVNVSGVEHYHCSGLPENVCVVSNQSTADFMEDGAFTVTAEDVEKLGQNVAVWGMTGAGVYLPAGLVEIGPAPLPAARKTKD